MRLYSMFVGSSPFGYGDHDIAKVMLHMTLTTKSFPQFEASNHNGGVYIKAMVKKLGGVPKHHLSGFHL